MAPQRQEGSPAGSREENGFDAILDSENFASYLASPDSTAARLHQIGQKFREVLQVKRMQEHASEVSEGNDNLVEAGANFKGAHVQSLVKSLISGKQSDEVPMLVEFMMRKVMEEFERRLRNQQDQSRKLKNSLKDLMARESKLASRARVLEALAAGSGEEIKLVTQQLHKMKSDKDNLENEMQRKEADMQKLELNRDEMSMTINILRNQLKVLEKEHQDNHGKQLRSEKLILEYDHKLKEVELELAECLSNLATATSERESFKQREEVYKEIITRQAGALHESKIMASGVKEDALSMQHCWKEQLDKLENELSELASAAQSYHDVLAENRRLYNEVQDLKGNIRVYCRVRPFLDDQCERPSSVEFVGENGEIMITNLNKHGKDSSKMFNFNKVYGPEASQEQVFMDTEPLIRSVLDGFNVCIFAYGQTGSGKTYTMSGPSAVKDDWGVNNRALYDLFQICQKRKDAFAYEVGVQMIEIYNEQVRDLLAADGVTKRLGIRNKSALNGLNVPEALMLPVATTSDVLEIMALGQRNRAVGATALNERSSRSHSVLTVHVQGTDLVKGCMLRGCLHLVDLAGSERVEKSEATGERLKEAQHINRSLSALGDVIAALAQKSSHVPYRNSKLTQLLQDSLGGHAKTLMFVHINPDIESYGETISTLKFAERVSAVELGAARTNREAAEIREYKDQISGLKEMLAKRDMEIERLNNAKAFDMEKQRLKSLPFNRQSIDTRGRKLVETSVVESRIPSRIGSADPWLDAPDESKRPASRPRTAPVAENAVEGASSPTAFQIAAPRDYHSESDGEQAYDIVHEFPGREQTGGTSTAAEYEGDSSEGDNSQESLLAGSELHAPSRIPRRFNALRAPSMQQQPHIPRPPRSEKKHPLSQSLSTGLRRLSDAGPSAALSSSGDYAMLRRATPTGSNGAEALKRSAAPITNAPGSSIRAGKRWL